MSLEVGRGGGFGDDEGGAMKGCKECEDRGMSGEDVGGGGERRDESWACEWQVGVLCEMCAEVRGGVGWRMSSDGGRSSHQFKPAVVN